MVSAPKVSSTGNAGPLIPASIVLQRLHDEVPAGHFTLSWLMDRLHRRSFGIILLLLALVAMAPGVAIVAGLLLLIPACQMMTGKAAPRFPRRIADRHLPTCYLAALVQRAVPVLHYLERLIHPRWATPFEVTKRLVGGVVALLSVTVAFTPLPLSNVVPALLIALIALAYAEEDGILLTVALIAAVVLLAVTSLAVWQAVLGVHWLGGSSGPWRRSAL